jgi:hypothetical protein
VRRRTQVIGRIPGETSARSPIWAVLELTSRGWRGVVMTPRSVAAIERLRRREHTASTEEVIIFMTAACAPHDYYHLTATVSQRGGHHTVNEATVGTEQLGVCTNPPSVFPFWQNGRCGSVVQECRIGSGFHPGRATVQWSGRTLDNLPTLPPAEEAGTTQVVIKRACEPRSSGLRPSAEHGGLADRC